MFFNYLKLSLRKFTRQKFYSLLNIFGLSTGMATVILIMMYVFDELSYDKFHRFEKDLYRVVENQYYSGQPVFPVAVTPVPLADGLEAEFPEVVRAARVQYSWDAFQRETFRFDTRGIYADVDFLSMFDFPLIKGDTMEALDGVGSIILTEKLAAKLFGSEDPMGKTITVNREREVMVTGVIRDLPHNSHLQFDYVMPMSYLAAARPSRNDDWGSNTLYTYVQLVRGALRDAVDAKLKRYLKTKTEGSVTELFLQPITDIHLSETSFVADPGRNGNMQYVRIFTIVATFILIIACINFMNLATARAMKRAREVGLRKAIGAYKHQLVVQFLGESVMVAFVAMAIALLFVDILLAPFNTLTQKSLDIDFTDITQGIIPMCLVATVVTGIVAGSYPAIFLSSFHPAHVLKGTVSNKSAGSTFRKLLVVVQFCVSIVMISGTIVIYSQIDYIRNINLGWDRENMLLIPNISNYQALKERIQNHSQIKAVSASDQHPSEVLHSSSSFGWRGKPSDEVMLFHLLGVDYDYLEAMKIE